MGLQTPLQTHLQIYRHVWRWALLLGLRYLLSSCGTWWRTSTFRHYSVCYWWWSRCLSPDHNSLSASRHSVLHSWSLSAQRERERERLYTDVTSKTHVKCCKMAHFIGHVQPHLHTGVNPLNYCSVCTEHILKLRWLTLWTDRGSVICLCL